MYLGNQKLPIGFTRVRNVHTNTEVPLVTYEKLQTLRGVDDWLLRRVLVGLSCGRYRECAETVPTAFGVSRSTVSRRFIRASAQRLKTLVERDLTGEDFVAVFLAGKSLAGEALVIAVGVTLQGEKVFLGVVQTATENARVLTEFVLGLVARLSRSFATTNVLESINAQVERLIRRVTRWHGGDQKLRWVASALLNLEPRLQRVKGYLQAALLRRAALATEATAHAA